MKKVILFALIVLSAFRASAQIDPTLAGMILLYDDKAKKALKSQESAMLLMTTGHIWTKRPPICNGNTTSISTASTTSSYMPPRYTDSIMKSVG